MPCIVRDDDERKKREISLIENIQREDLNPIEKAPFICKQNKCIQFRQHHILMNIRIITKKRKYLVI